MVGIDPRPETWFLRKSEIYEFRATTLPGRRRLLRNPNSSMWLLSNGKVAPFSAPCYFPQRYIIVLRGESDQFWPIRGILNLFLYRDTRKWTYRHFANSFMRLKWAIIDIYPISNTLRHHLAIYRGARQWKCGQLGAFIYRDARKWTFRKIANPFHIFIYCEASKWTFGHFANLFRNWNVLLPIAGESPAHSSAGEFSPSIAFTAAYRWVLLGIRANIFRTIYRHIVIPCRWALFCVRVAHFGRYSFYPG